MGVMGAAGGDIPQEVMERVFQLGKEIAKRGYVLITGACPGIPHEAVKGAKTEGGFVVGISPGLNLEEHVTKYHSPTWGYDAIIYTGSGLMGREIENIRSCDVVIFAGGRSGTLGEFAIAYDESKIIGVLEGSGGITDHLDKVVSYIQKKSGAKIVGSPYPAELLNKLEVLYEERLLPSYTKLMKTNSPHGELDI